MSETTPIEIRSRGDGRVLFRAGVAASIPPEDHTRAAVEAAVRERADLAGAYLAGADLAGANLTGADLARAYLAGADLAGADLAGANLAGANLARANLARANLAGALWRDDVKLRHGPVKEASRSDGWLFRLLDCEGGWRVAAGCRCFALPEAWAHWTETRGGTLLGEETFDILRLFEAHIARLERSARE